MDLIIDIVRNIVLIVLFASVIEMFLPKSTMGRYVQLIMGLFVIITILNPIMNLRFKDFQLNVLDLGKTEQSVIASGMDEGLSLRESNHVLAKETAISHIKNQVTALVTLVPGVEEVEVQLVTDPAFIDNGEITEIMINVKSKGQKENDLFVETVKINTSYEGETSTLELFPQETAQRIKEIVSNFYGLDMSKIQVFVK